MMKNDARHVRGIIDGLLARWQQGPQKKASAVIAAFSDAAGEEATKHARPVSLKNGILMVIVDNSPWLYKLTLEKKKILKKFNEKYTGKKKARDIRFRIGDISA